MEIAAVCEIDGNIVGAGLADIKKLDLPEPRTFTDVRKVLQDKSVDAISVAAPNHWHSLMGPGHAGLARTLTSKNLPRTIGGKANSSSPP